MGGFTVLSGGFMEYFSDLKMRTDKIDEFYQELLDVDALFLKELEVFEGEASEKGFSEETLEENPP